MKISLFLGFCSISFFAIFSLADGTTDAFYLKFASSKQSSLIVGSSRAAQGIIPQMIQNKELDYDIYNYAFTIAHTPYGKVYYESIKRKLDVDSKNGLFLICVNPWTISSKTIHSEDSLHFRENGSFIDKTYFVNLNPNIEYLVESYDRFNIDIITNKKRKGDYQTFFTHNNGWLEVTIESDMISNQERTLNKIKSYKKKLDMYSGYSQNRMFYLKKTIELLMNHGDVYLVRLPVNDDMLYLEEQLLPDFDVKMEALSRFYQIEYINAIPFRKKYKYTDGHHLELSSGEAFSNFLASEIKNNKLNTLY
ncbi:hypothetical protein AAFP94_04770 [Flavobacteriaceae bacterium MJ-SS4]|uniref:hypothetical protein n=1 Tax=Gilvirhabdus luticola TaxID=3079858 RepID=UPI0032DC3A0F